MSTATVVIPARFDSTRFPGKVLADETGKPLIQHVYEQADQASRVGCVIVATDDQRIFLAVEAFGGWAVMTRVDHANGTSRIAEAADAINAKYVVNVQGDEPEIDPDLIDLAIEKLADDESCPMGTVASPFGDDEDPADPNIVKVVLDQRGRALYFSRSSIPFDRDGNGKPHANCLKHVGMYVYRRAFLNDYVQLAPTPLERLENLEQLRVLEHGYRIAVAIGESSHHGIDTPEQYAQFVKRWKKRNGRSKS